MLVVEDDSDTRQAICDLLADAGHTVRAAADGEEAIQQLTDETVPGIIVVDTWMPRMTGPELLTWIAQQPRFNHVPVIIASADRRATCHPRAAFTLAKPFDASELLDAIRTYCSR
ncbi:MAG TPA: response regulator [Myxococcales bacterium]|nr:response regulator [Myxococcales bacterium]